MLPHPCQLRALLDICLGFHEIRSELFLLDEPDSTRHDESPPLTVLVGGHEV
jgi:hypothetical protein